MWGLLCVSAIAMGAMVLAMRPGDVRYRVWRGTAWLAASDVSCGTPRGASSALLDGLLTPADAARCAEALMGGDDRRRALLERLTADQTTPATIRLTTAAMLFERGDLDPRLARSLLAGRDTAPALRRALVVTLGGRPGGGEIARIGHEEAVHDTWGVGAMALDGAAEPDFGRAAQRALQARPDAPLTPWAVTLLGLGASTEALRAAHRRAPSGQRAGLYEPATEVLNGTPWGVDGRQVVYALTRWRADAAQEADPPDQPPLAAGDSLLGLIAEDGPADALREQIHAVAGWIERGPPDGRSARLLAAVAHPGAVPATGAEAWLGEPGLGPALQDGTGAPAAVVFLATALGAEVGVPVQATLRGDGVRLELGGIVVYLDACGARAPETEGAVALPEGGWDALLLRAEAGAHLRRGEWSEALTLLRAAEGVWRGGPDAAVGRLLLASVGADPGGDPGGEAGRTATAVLDPSLAARFAPLAARLPPTRRRGPVRIVDAGFGGGRDGDLRSLPTPGTTDAARVATAWWLARMGRGDDARRLLTAPVPSGLADAAAGVAFLLGEPARTLGPVSAWAAGEAPAPFTGCPAATPLWPAFVTAAADAPPRAAPDEAGRGD